MEQVLHLEKAEIKNKRNEGISGEICVDVLPIHFIHSQGEKYCVENVTFNILCVTLHRCLGGVYVLSPGCVRIANTYGVYRYIYGICHSYS